MTTICPRCGYVRKSTDLSPSWKCPSCGVIEDQIDTDTAMPDSQAIVDAFKGKAAKRHIRLAAAAFISIIALLIGYFAGW